MTITTLPCGRCGADSWKADDDGVRCVLCGRPQETRAFEEPELEGSEYRRPEMAPMLKRQENVQTAAAHQERGMSAREIAKTMGVQYKTVLQWLLETKEAD